jgi:hypothetical protein
MTGTLRKCGKIQCDRDKPFKEWISYKWYIRIQFVPHRKHVASPIQRPADSCCLKGKKIAIYLWEPYESQKIHSVSRIHRFCVTTAGVYRKHCVLKWLMHTATYDSKVNEALPSKSPSISRYLSKDRLVERRETTKNLRVKIYDLASKIQNEYLMLFNLLKPSGNYIYHPL